jgi:hypothetical protein
MPFRLLFAGLPLLLSSGIALAAQPIRNWSAPATWSPPKARGVTTLSETSPLPFIAVTPCRVADTRGNGFTGQYGPPSLVANATRSFTIAGQCGIPTSAAAVSFNFAALDVSSAGDLRVFPAGGSVPLVSTLNYNANTPNIANAAILELGTFNHAITVQADAASINLIIDVNGYYYSASSSVPLAPGESFGVSGDVVSGGIVEGFNSSATDYACGVEGYVFASTGLVFGVGGINVVSPTDGAAGVYGRSQQGGNTYGVFGTSYSSTGNPAGVAGVDFSGAPTVNAAGLTNSPAGVLGLSTTKVGVEGDSRDAGVRGRLLDTNGNVVHLGILGFSTYGVYSNGDYGGVGAKFFVEPHATDPTKVVRFVALEGNESGTYFRGSARIVNGTAVIAVPEEFRMVTDEEGLTVQLTPVGAAASMFVASEDLDSIVVRSNRDVKFHYQVNGIRRAYKDYVPVVEGQEFMPYSPSAGPLESYPAEIRRRLVANGTYNADGSINMETAERVGWTRIWKEWEERDRAAAAANAAAHPARSPAKN